MSARFLLMIPMALAVVVVHAEQTRSPGSAAEESSLQEVVVTAQKREERLQDVPVAVSAIGAEQLNSRGIQNVMDLSGLTPNVTVLPAALSNTGFQISIRGAAQQNPALYWDPTVGLYIDGVYIGKNTGNVFDVVDLERIEVLRGPQGTLYGRNTLAGAVNFITRQPSGEFGGSVQLDLGDYDLRTAKASLDLPRFGIASVSLAARKHERDGTTRTTPGSPVSELDNRDSTSARIAVNLDFTDTFQAAYRFDYTDIDQTPLHSYLSRANPVILPFLQPFVTDERQETVSIDAPAFERSKVQGHALTMTWEVNSANTLKSISAYRKLEWSDSADFDGSPVPVAYLARNSDYDAVSQELQLVGSAARFNYVSGLYYFKDDSFTRNPQHFFFGTVNYDSRYGSGTKAWAAYGQVDYKVTDTLTLTAGLRYTREKKEIDRQLAFQVLPAMPGYATLINPGTTASETFTDTTPVFIVAYKFSDAVNAYAKYAEGFKSGGFNGEYGDPDPSPAGVAFNEQETRTPFQPEKVKSYELGLKTSLAGGRAILNAAVFQNDTDDLQLSVFRNVGAFSSVIRNAGQATTRGFELEAIWAPSDAFKLQASYGYLDAKYDEYIDAGVNEADNRAFIHAPKNTLNLLAEVRLARMAWGELRSTLDYSWIDDYYTYPYQLASSGPRYNPALAVAGDTRVESYGVLNARLALSEISFGNTQAQVALWSRNLTDEEHVTNYIDFGPAFGSMRPAYYLEPRTYGLEVSFHW